ncbi:Karyogamy KAR9 protein [Rutstroemia sp. NJR-2017a BBW]|nr:Karyogamy KAR9 protein [Rutstroemia sp. NJR-2017a BBW]
MYESVERSLNKLKESLDAGLHLNNPATMGKKIENYEAKKVHYGPAIERVLSIIEKGVKDRLTVNGEILRLHSDMQHKWDTLKEQMNDLDSNTISGSTSELSYSYQQTSKTI